MMYRVHRGQISIAHFSHQKATMRFVAARARARPTGAETLMYEAFTEAEESLPALTRFHRRMDDASRFCYRLGGRHYGDCRYVAAASRFTVAAGLRPDYAFRRIWRQLLSPRARRRVRSGRRDGRTQ